MSGRVPGMGYIILLWHSLSLPYNYFEPVLSNEDKVSCSRTQHNATGEILTLDLAIKSPALYQLSELMVLQVRIMFESVVSCIQH